MGQLKKVFVILNDEDRLLPARESGPTSGANSLPLSGRGARRGRGVQTRGGRGGHADGFPSNKRGPEDAIATPAKTRRGK